MWRNAQSQLLVSTLQLSFMCQYSSQPLTAGKAASSVRTVITMDEIRKEYQQELDRIACIENNQFAFAGSDEMDVL